MEKEEFTDGGIIYIENADYHIVRELMFPEKIKDFFNRDSQADYFVLGVQLLLKAREGIESS